MNMGPSDVEWTNNFTGTQRWNHDLPYGSQDWLIHPLPTAPEWDLIDFTDEASASTGSTITSIPTRNSPMRLIRFYFFLQIILMASFAISMPHALAQRGNLQDRDQPGLVPDAADEELSPEFARQTVSYRTSEAPGTIIVQTSERFLYVIQPNGRAIRYGIGVGRDGFQWQGLLRITRKQEWPDWTPPPEMIERQPYLPRFMAGGPGNPLGARALYLGTTVYRIHGTNAPQTIGTAVSSGCFRLVNPDVIDLYDRIPVGTKVIVRQQPEL
jgi:lipoprotein-anchoring transpeptidase ErfK/SrfK